MDLNFVKGTQAFTYQQRWKFDWPVYRGTTSINILVIDVVSLTQVLSQLLKHTHPPTHPSNHPHTQTAVVSLTQVSSQVLNTVSMAWKGIPKDVEGELRTRAIVQVRCLITTH